MKAITKKQIGLAIVIVWVLSFIVPTMVVAEETLLLASLNRSAPTEEFDRYDFFPDYHQEARKKEEVRKEIAKENIVDSLVTDAAWIGGQAYAPVAVVTGESGGFTDKIIIPYEVMNFDFVGLIERVLTKYGGDMADAADTLLSM